MATREERLAERARQIQVAEKNLAEKKAKRDAAAKAALAEHQKAQDEEALLGPVRPIGTAARAKTKKPVAASDDGEWKEPIPQRRIREEAQLNIVDRIANPPEDLLPEMGRMPSGMVMSSCLMEFQYRVIMLQEHPGAALRKALYRAFRGRDGLLIKDLQKLFDTQSEQAQMAGQRIMP